MASQPAQRGRPRGSKNKTKDATSSAKKPDLKVVDGLGAVSIGDNSDQQRALTMHHKANYIAALAKKKEADAAFKNVCKAAKADLGDTGVKDIKLLIEIDNAGDNSVVKQTIERLMRCAAWAGLPVGTQASLFDEDRRTLLEKAYEDGKYAGLNGKNPQSPHQAGSDLDQAWMRGWHDGQGALKKVFLERNETKVLRPVETKPRDDDDDAALAADDDSSMGDDAFKDADEAEDGDGEESSASFDRPGRVAANGLEIVGESPAGLAPAPDIKWPDGAGEEEDLRPRHLSQDDGDL